MATRDCALPADGSATGQGSVTERIEIQRSALFDAMAIIGVATESKNADSADMSRTLRLCYERLDEVASELESIGFDASTEVANG